MNIKGFDLNLLRVFAAVDSARNVSKAAAMIGLSQPAMSNALARLRKACDDQLFVRTPAGMAPTALAIEMSPAVREALAQMERALGGPAEFLPQRAHRRFRILMSDAGQSVIVPSLMNALTDKAPGITIESLQMPREHYAEILEMGGADVAIGSINTSRAGIHQQLLFNDSYCFIVRSDHPYLRNSLSFKQFASSRHIVVANGGAEELIQRAFDDRNAERVVALNVPQYHTAVETVRQTDLIAAIPSRLLGSDHGLQKLTPPIELPPAHVKMHWHRRFDGDPGNVWLRSLLLDLAASGA